MNQNVYLTEVQLSEIYGNTPRFWQNKRLVGGGPVYTKIGRSVRYRQDIVEKWAEGNFRSSTSEKTGQD